MQGAELMVLRGASRALQRALVLQLEVPWFGQYNAGAPTFAEIIAFLDRYGFVVYEVLHDGPVRIGKQQFAVQADFLFVRKDYQAKYNATAT